MGAGCVDSAGTVCYGNIMSMIGGDWGQAAYTPGAAYRPKKLRIWL